jgi:hypothetical protein
MSIFVTLSNIDVDKLRGYLKHKISNWYVHAKIDYNVNGKFNKITTFKEHLTIHYTEDGKDKELEIVYFNDYTMEQIYDIWQSEG